jgi:hypothetical protein
LYRVSRSRTCSCAVPATRWHCSVHSIMAMQHRSRGNRDARWQPRQVDADMRMPTR